MQKLDLNELAYAAQGGNRDALEQLVRALQDPLYRLSLRFLGHRENARDATQEILILILTKLSTFRGESALSTWAYRVACRHLLQTQEAQRRSTFSAMVAEDLAKPANDIEPSSLQSADARLLEEEVFLGCTQAMLRALDREQRIAFVLGALCEVASSDAAFALGISEAAFRKRLSRARSTLDAFMGKHCGVANPQNPCRCAYQVNHRVAKRALDPACLRYAAPVDRTSLETLRAQRELKGIRRSLDLYRAQPLATAPEDVASHIRALITAPGMRLFDA